MFYSTQKKLNNNNNSNNKQRQRSIISFLQLFFWFSFSIHSTLAERTFDELEFTKEKCHNLDSSTNEFEVCAVLEFCTSTTATSDSNYDARYGYRLEGSKEEDCKFPGPIMRLKNGLRHGLFLRGIEEEETNLHFHGLHISGKSPDGNGYNNLYRSIIGKENMLVYDINLSSSHSGGGTYWYHSHLHGKAWDQVKGGAFGMIIISADVDAEDVGTSDMNVLDFLSSKQSERILIISDANSDDGKYIANGNRNIETYKFNTNQWYRLRILIVGIDSHTSGINVGFTDDDNDTNCKIHALAHDGIYRFEVPKQESMLQYPLTTSSRLDAAIQCTYSSPGSSTTKITANDQTIGEIRILESNDNQAATPFENETESWKSKRMEYIKDLQELEETATNLVQPTMKLRVDETNINGISQGSHKPLCNKNTKDDFQYGTVEEWKFSGVNTHPFHLHIYPMQVVSDGCGPNHDKGEYYDTILAPESSLSNPCIVRIYLIDYDGPATLHCHLFEHSQHGAITWLNVVNKNEEDGATEDQNDTISTTCIGQCAEPTETPKLCNGDNYIISNLNRATTTPPPAPTANLQQEEDATTTTITTTPPPSNDITDDDKEEKEVDSNQANLSSPMQVDDNPITPSPVKLPVVNKPTEPSPAVESPVVINNMTPLVIESPVAADTNTSPPSPVVFSPHVEQEATTTDGDTNQENSGDDPAAEVVIEEKENKNIPILKLTIGILALILSILISVFTILRDRDIRNRVERDNELEDYQQQNLRHNTDII